MCFLLKKKIILEIIPIYYYQTEIGMKSYLVVAVNCLWGYENFAKRINLYIDRSKRLISFTVINYNHYIFTFLDFFFVFSLVKYLYKIETLAKLIGHFETNRKKYILIYF